MSNKLEIILRKVGRELADYQVARIFKVPEEMQQSPCDFFGYTVYGRAILIEAKMVDRESLPICSSPGLLPHQWGELSDANRAGALTLICWSRGSTVAVISMDMAIALSGGRKSIPWSAISPEYMRPLAITHSLQLLDHWLPLPTKA